jgi:copper chaperone CopZ
MKSVTVKIDGMSCDHCVRAVRQALEGLSQVDVQTVKIGSASVRYDESTGTESILAAIVEAGYSAETTTADPGEALDA